MPRPAPTHPTLPHLLPLLLSWLHRAARRMPPRPVPGARLASIAAGTGDEAAWLAAAADLGDLERRLQRLERGRPDRFGPLPP